MISFFWRLLKGSGETNSVRHAEAQDEGRDATPPSQRAPNKRRDHGGRSPTIWSRLPIDLVIRTASFLSANEIACTARMLCKASAAHFNGPEHSTVALSQPVPPHAFTHRWGRPGAMHCLPFMRRMHLLLLTAGSGGSASNLAVVLEAVDITGFRELDLYEAAAKGGSLELCKLLWQQECGLPAKAERDKAAMLAGATAGKLDICVWLHHELSVPWASARHSVMDVLATAGHVTACQRLHEQESVPYTEAVLAAAARLGDLALCQSLQRAGCPCGRAAFKAALVAGHQAVCDWLLESDLVNRIDAVVVAAEAGQPALVTQLLANAPLVNGSSDSYSGGGASAGLWNRLLPAAAAGCDLPTLQALFRRAAAAANSNAAAETGTTSSALQDGGALRLPSSIRGKVLAAAADSLTDDWRQKTSWLMDVHGWRLTEDRLRAVRSDREGTAEALQRLLWLQANGLRTEKPLDMEMLGILFRGAAKGDDAAALEVLLAAHVVTHSRHAASTLANRGHWEVLLLLHSRGRRISADMVADVARRLGQVAPLEALLAALGPAVVLSPEVTRGAAESGSVELVAWMQQRGYQLDVGDCGIFAAAARGGSEEMLERLVERGCNMGTDGAAYLAAAVNGDMRTLRCVRRLGCPWGQDTFATACRRAVLPALRWMLEEGFPVQLGKARESATLRRSFEVSSWLMTLKRK